MTDSRATILANIRAGLKQASRLPAPVLPEPAPAGRSGEFDRARLMEQFANELAGLGGQFILSRRERFLAIMMEIFEAREAKSALMWGRESLPVVGLRAALQREGIELVGPMAPAESAERQIWLKQAAAAKVGITGAEAALADSGALLLRSGPGQGRLASLIVETHVAVVTPEQFYPAWADWLDEKARADEISALTAQSSNLVLIAGPSRTADIEMTLTIGVHGPKEVIVVCLAD